MARKAKKGLEYFPLDVALFSDIKIRKLIKYQSGNAVTVYVNLLCSIYKNGYYIKWDKELPFIISEDTGFEEAFISEAIKCCINVDLFSRKIYNENQVLTSKAIQERYELICKQSKKASVISEFNAITPDYSGIIAINPEVMPIIPEKPPITSEEMPQSKVKESKEKESKVNEIAERVFHALSNEQFFKDLPNSDAINQIANDLSLTVDEVKNSIERFRPNAELSYPNFSKFGFHFKKWLNLNRPVNPDKPKMVW